MLMTDADESPEVKAWREKRAAKEQQVRARDDAAAIAAREKWQAEQAEAADRAFQVTGGW